MLWAMDGHAGVEHGERAPIFDAAERTDARPSNHRESTYAFMSRIAGDYWQHPRDLMQTWANRIDDPAEYFEIRQRLLSDDNSVFNSAFLELYLHECLLRNGWRVTVHPDVPGTTRHPDFYAERDGTGFYLEAISPGTSADQRAASNRRAVLFDVVDGLGDPNFFLALEELTEGARPPASARLRTFLRRELSQLDPDSYETYDSAPVLTWSHDGWSATFRPIAKRPEARGVREDERTIGVYAHGGVNFIDDAPKIRRALEIKSSRYGDLRAPFVIAVGTYIHDHDRWHSSGAILGSHAVQFGTNPDGTNVTRAIRQPDGFFGTPPEWQHRDVSGVLLVNQLMPYYVQRAEVTLWLHPNPLHAITQPLGFPGPTIAVEPKPNGASLVEVPSTQGASQLFELPDPWPPGEPWPHSQA